MPLHGTWTATGGGDRRMPILIILCLVVAAAIGGGAATGLIAAVTVFLYWVAGIMVFTVASGAAFLILTRKRRAENNLAFAQSKELQRKQYYVELEERHARRAAITAAAQANAFAPYAALIAQALHGDKQPEPEPAYRMKAEVVKIGDKEVEPR